MQYDKKKNSGEVAPVLQALGLRTEDDILYYISDCPDRKSHYRLFEAAVAHLLKMLQWKDIPKEEKVKRGCRAGDTGVDCISPDFKHAVQVKWFAPGSNIAYNKFGTFRMMGDILRASRLTIVTSEDVRLGELCYSTIMRHCVLSDSDFANILFKLLRIHQRSAPSTLTKPVLSPQSPPADEPAKPIAHAHALICGSASVSENPVLAESPWLLKSLANLRIERSLYGKQQTGRPWPCTPDDWWRWSANCEAQTSEKKTQSLYWLYRMLTDLPDKPTYEEIDGEKRVILPSAQLWSCMSGESRAAYLLRRNALRKVYATQGPIAWETRSKTSIKNICVLSDALKAYSALPEAQRRFDSGAEEKPNGYMERIGWRARLTAHRAGVAPSAANLQFFVHHFDDEDEMYYSDGPYFSTQKDEAIRTRLRQLGQGWCHRELAELFQSSPLKLAVAPSTIIAASASSNAR